MEAQKEKVKRLNEIAKKVNLPQEEVEPNSLLFTTDIDDAIAQFSTEYQARIDVLEQDVPITAISKGTITQINDLKERIYLKLHGPTGATIED